MSNTQLIEAQHALEDESRALGIARYRTHREAAWKQILAPNIDEAALPPGRMLLRKALRPTIEAVSGFLGAASSGGAGRRHSAVKLLAGVQPEPLAYLTLRSAIQSGVTQDRLQRAAIKVANAIIGHIEAEAFERSNPAGATGLQRYLARHEQVSRKRLHRARDIYRREGVALDWSQRDRLLVGTRLIELATDATGLFELVLVEEGHGRRRRKEYQLRLTEVAHDWLERQHARCELLDPIPLPMVVPPRPWSTPFDGGYLTPPIGNALVRSPSRPYLEDLAAVEMPQVYRAVNMIQSTGWQINRRILEAMRQVWEGGGSLGGLPYRDDAPLPGKPADIDTSEIARAMWKKAATSIHADNARRRSKRLALIQKLWVAEKLVDFPAIYFPHSLDFRGRCYPIPKGSPNPQGDDTSRALLRFAKGMPLGAAGGRWLAVHLANLFGIDKVSFDDRVRWVEQNSAAILDSAADPLDGRRFWAAADKPWQFLAACFEWAGFQSEGEAFVSHLPVALDGSNSGLQHFTAMLRDPEAAPHVNLVEQPRPGDLYALVARVAQDRADRSDHPDAKAWQDGRITRQIVKRPCMTYAYSATRRGMAGQIEGTLRELDDAAALRGEAPYLSGADNAPAAFWLAGLLLQILAETVPAARRAMDWLQTTARLLNKANLPLVWVTPVGLPVLQSYPNVRSRSVEVTYGGRRLQLQLYDGSQDDTLEDYLEARPGAVFDGNRSANSVAPNFVHSMDAAHLMLVANRCADQHIDSIAVTHDSFGTHAANTDRLAAILRETFAEIYHESPLPSFRDHVIDQLRRDPECSTKVPEMPAFGGFDLGEVRRAAYMFA